MLSVVSKQVQSLQFRYFNKALGCLQSTRTNTLTTEPKLSAPIRSLEVINSNGVKTQLNNVMKEKKSVVIFLRHLG